MFLQLSQLTGLPVASQHDEARVGTILDVVLHPQTGELVGFWVQPNGWLTPKRALSSRDVLGYDPLGVIVQCADVFVDAEEIQPFHRIVSSQDRWLGKRVQSESGKVFGTVTDVVIDVDLAMLAKLDVRTLFGSERLIARDQILRVTPSVILVRTLGEASLTEPLTVPSEAVA
ncbi:PRC-barrel domain-containing protein [Candidatus Berkelbacteria bacterium]|nr:PRC-barrel domain-containing protein [Candidatus Berkelbacteria bacterium]